MIPDNRLNRRRFSQEYFVHTGLRGNAKPVQANRLHNANPQQPFRPLPAPTGPRPYHLDLASVIPDQIAAINAAGKLTFHLVGDTGGVQTPYPQMSVARMMEQDSQKTGQATPEFFYQVGDVVYFYGEAVDYFPQFYEPYADYAAPIFAIPGNHDGDLSPQMETQGVSSLAAFVSNFCASTPQHTREALDAVRDAMTQPNVYWTLLAPFATIVGLYTNVPEGGMLDNDQYAWLVGELAQAPTDRALILTMHHPIYSLDTHHSGSGYMATKLDEAIAESQRVPDAVFAGHVHNYQRFTRTIQNRQIPFIVAGAGGYHNLHQEAQGQPGFPATVLGDVPNTPGVRLESFCDDRFGFLRLEASPTSIHGTYFAISNPLDPAAATAQQIDEFTLDLANHLVSTP